ncbi:hypothetical protein INT43_005812 [Umbelopsis isabellina]|uniref:Nuclear pore protein n=1 Tax=Mortierella isabellina TaxID=91625 RepID=A0A8H7PJN6_MORIS|nr:hypothetical protein INT43_005812 [Umbelopsis isabellina]
MPITLKQLFEKSQLLTTSVNESELPYIERRLDQIESQSKNLLNQSSKESQKPQDINSRAHFLLANAGINTHQLVNDLDAIQLDKALSPVAPLYSTDVEGFLKQVHQESVISALEDSQYLPGCEQVNLLLQQHTENGANDSHKANTDNDMQGVSEDKWKLPTYTKGTNLLAAIRKRNLEAMKAKGGDKKDGEMKGVEEKSKTATDTKPLATSSPANVWQLIDRLLEANPDANNTANVEQNSALLKSYKTFLEEHAQKIRRLDNAKTGGTYYIDHLNNCRADVALEFVGRNEALFKTEPQFIYYLQEYLADANHIPSKHTRSTILESYRRLCYSTEGADPYKMALFKILGRCELYKKNLPEVTPSIEDYLWLQLSLVREISNSMDPSTDAYTLNDLQQLLKKFEPQFRSRSNPSISQTSPFIRK